ncbi:MAG: phosphoribosylamine--glycine ligase [Pseudomonadota bacterium]
MKILIIGSGGREHALADKIKQSLLVSEIFCSAGNGGISQDVKTVSLKNNQEIINFCKENDISLVVIGPETPLVEGLADILVENNIKVFGPSKKAAQLEGSKGFTKNICRKYNIPTANYESFSDIVAAKEYIKANGAPIVIKADGLAAGKGVTVAMTEEEALQAVDEIMGGKFGSAGASIVIEEYLEGEEVSFFALCDGENAIEFASAQDHKRVGDGDTGANTGGMGTYSPAPLMTEELRKQVMDKIINPTVKAMKAEQMPFVGVLFAGLMINKGEAKLIEFNTRFGDPETQVLMMRLESDLIPALLACANGNVKDIQLKFSEKAAVCVVMAAKGYPENYEKGTIIRGLDNINSKNIKVFHAGTEIKEGDFIANGGRVLGVTALGDTIKEAQLEAYKAVANIDWKEGFFRRDIGHRAIK